MLKSIILGIIQGIGEFLPISSSAHLILVPYLFGWEQSSLAYDIALHFGTLLAVLVIFFKDWWNLFIGAVDKVTKGKDSFENKMFWYLVIATIPGALLGVLLDDVVENIFRQKIWLIASSLAIMGVLIYLGDRWADKHYKIETDFKHISLKQAFLIGLSQALAIIPGFSRSGTTILTARLLGLSKSAATKFTFLLSVPIIAGATILEIGNLAFTWETLMGVFTAFIVGIFSIKFLLNYIKRHDFSVFAIYRVIFAAIILIKYFIF
ncbi:MAG: undecaprenyl-diphosphatase UppP [Mycoplasmatota bacterium]|nr:undecaprenyl-diphosphatase UppP [Mycoplasmatota bacterium]